MNIPPPPLSQLKTYFSQKSRAPTNGTPHSSRRSVTSDYESSSILDSASMYGGEEHSASSPSAHSQNISFGQHQREVNVDEHVSSKSKKKSKEPAPILAVTKPSDSHSSISAKGSEISPKADSVFGLSTIKESYDPEENLSSSRQHTDDEVDFDGYFNQVQQKKTKKQAPTLPPSKEQRISTNSQSDDIRTPSASISMGNNSARTSSTLTKQSDDLADSTDDDVDELLGNLEVRFAGKYMHTYIHIHTHMFSHIRRALFSIDKINHLHMPFVCLCAMYFPLVQSFICEKKNTTNFL